MMKPIRKPDITARDVGGETLLYSAEEKAIHVLNPTARLVWELCDGEHTVASMEQAIRANFSVTSEHDVTGDIRRTLETFAEKGLLNTIA
jgi:hypothetical protein